MLSASLTPRALRTGRTATLRLVLAARNAAAFARDGRLTCAATASKRSLRTTARTLRAGKGNHVVATCTWRIAREAAGTSLRAWAIVAYGDEIFTRSLSRRVR